MLGEAFTYLEHIHTTPENFAIVIFIKIYATESEKIQFFKVFNTPTLRILRQNCMKVFFQLKTLIKVTLEIFSDMV